jgi:hypothetical protein
MTDTTDKLARGFRLLARSGGDSDMLGVALLAIHGALEDHLRAQLLALPDLDERARRQLEHYSAWLPLVRLAQQHLDLSPGQRRAIQEAGLLRQSFAYGEPFAGGVGTLLHYGRLVETLCGRAGLLRETLLAERQSRRGAPPDESGEGSRDARALPPELEAQIEPAPARPPAQPEPPEEEQDDWESWDEPERDMTQLSIPWLRVLVPLVFLIALCLVAGEISARLDLPRLVGTLGLAGQPTATPAPIGALPSATPELRARLVGVGAGPGWLHEAPDFASATLPLPLRDGMPATVLDRRQTAPDGTVWQYVSVSGYEGWCPLANLDLDR